tara:strand:- start:43793 stop:44830 length:1038 start_codon:yes stop_codon:yes gene_type:complete
MKIKQGGIFFLLLFSYLSVFAQYTETINSNRPGFSQGAFSVGTQILQFEAGFGLGKEEHNLLNTETSAFIIDYNVRYGVWKEELEVSLIGAYQSNSITLLENGSTYKESNFTSNTLGAKYLFFDPYRKKELEKPNLYSWKANNGFHWKDLIPAISIYAGANFDQADNPLTHTPNNKITFFTEEVETGMEISPTVAIATQNNWGSWVFVINLIGERFTLDEKSYSYILTLTHTFNAKLSAFIENQGIKSDFYADQIFRGGAAYLVTKDFQIDAAVLLNIKDTPSRLYGRLGVSYRFDMHKKDEFIEDKGKAGREKKKEEKNTTKKKKGDKKSKRKDSLELEDDGGN